MAEAYDIIVIGAGMAGASVACELASAARVILLEREEQPGYHSTGRSAAAFIPSYGHNIDSLRVLTRQSLDFLQQPPASFRGAELLQRRGLLTLCAESGSVEAEKEYATLKRAIPSLHRVDGEAIRRLLPLVTETYACTGWFEPDVFDIDVHALHEGYIRGMRERGGRIENRSEVQSIERADGGWQVSTSVAQYSAPIIVNAAGAWADEIAVLAGVSPIGLPGCVPLLIWLALHWPRSDNWAPTRAC